jgi:phosphoribosyl 1,2-cyclic phosphodiesterase
MRPDAVFTVRYWGVTGTVSAPLRPSQVTDKLVAALCLLAERGRLGELRPGPGLEAAARRLAEQELPFSLRSTYGGNTTCVEVQTPDALIILDCGSGLRELGLDLEARWRAAGPGAVRSAHVLVTHPHGDHTFTTPYCGPFFEPTNTFTIWGSQKVLDSLAVLFDPGSDLSRLYFPQTYALMKGLEKFRAVGAGDEFQIGSTRIRTHALNHPGGCLAYRLDNAGRSFVFATDHEQPEVPDRTLAEFARGADLLYTEGQYTRAEYEGIEGIGGSPPEPRRGWGHTPLDACVITAVAAGVGELHVGHRDPQRDDDQLAGLEALARELMREALRGAGRPEGSCRVCIPHEGLMVRL